MHRTHGGLVGVELNLELMNQLPTPLEFSEVKFFHIGRMAYENFTFKNWSNLLRTHGGSVAMIP